MESNWHLPVVVILGKGLCHDQRERQRGITVQFDRTRSGLDLTPRDRFIGSSTRVRAVVLLTSVDEHREICTIALHKQYSLISDIIE